MAWAPTCELGLGVDPALCLHAYFDGGCKVKQRLGTQGYLVYRHYGTLLAAAANYHGHKGPANNVSEAWVLVDCITSLDKVCWGETTGLVVTGDSRLVISFMHRTARPGKRELVTAI